LGLANKKEEQKDESGGGGFWDYEKETVPSKDKVKEQILKENQGQPSSNYLSKLRARK
jgi:hypothetical protein